MDRSRSPRAGKSRPERCGSRSDPTPSEFSCRNRLTAEAGKDNGTEIVLYEVPDQRRDGKVVAAMWDGHAQVLSQKEFDDMLK